MWHAFEITFLWNTFSFPLHWLHSLSEICNCSSQGNKGFQGCFLLPIFFPTAFCKDIHGGNLAPIYFGGVYLPVLLPKHKMAVWPLGVSGIRCCLCNFLEGIYFAVPAKKTAIAEMATLPFCKHQNLVLNTTASLGALNTCSLTPVDSNLLLVSGLGGMRGNSGVFIQAHQNHKPQSSFQDNRTFDKTFAWPFLIEMLFNIRRKLFWNSLFHKLFYLRYTLLWMHLLTRFSCIFLFSSRWNSPELKLIFPLIW